MGFKRWCKRKISMLGYVIDVNGAEFKGLLGYGEIPDLKYYFRKMADEHGANIVPSNASATMTAQKGSTQLSLTIKVMHGTFPSRRVINQLEIVMDEYFGESNNKRGLDAQ